MDDQRIRLSRGTRLPCISALCLTCWLAGCGGDERRTASEASSPDEKVREVFSPAVQLPASCHRWPLPDPLAQVDGAFTIQELENEFRKSWKETDAKYAGKMMEVSGPITHTGRNMGGEPIVRLGGSDWRFEVTCVLRSFDALRNLDVGETCRIRGVYSVSIVPTFIHCDVVGTAERHPGNPIDKHPAKAGSDRGPPDVTLTAEQFNSEIEADPMTTTRKYVGKVMQLTGRLSRISHVVDGAIVYRLDGGSTSRSFGVQCNPRTGSPWSCVRPGQTVTLVGEGFRSYPCLMNCDVITVGGLANPAFTAMSLAETFESDRADFQKKFYLQQLLVSGEVSEKSPVEGIEDQFEITLRSTPATRVVCEMEQDEFMASESVRIGDSITIIGWNTKLDRTDSVTLVNCLFWRGN